MVQNSDNKPLAIAMSSANTRLRQELLSFPNA